MDKNEITMTSEEVKPVERIKAINPVIVVNMKDDKSYYSIQYYNLKNETCCFGYSSFNLNYVKEWLAKYFEPVEVDVIPIKYGHWDDIGNDVVCSECSCSAYDGYTSNYCPDCGAKLIFKDDEKTGDNV